MSFRFEMSGNEKMVARIQAFDKKFRRSALTKVGNEESKPVAKAMKANAPKQTGSWRKAIGRKVKVLRGGAVMFWIVGPRSKYIATGQLVTPPEGLRISQTDQGEFVFWRGADGRIKRMATRQKRRPVMYSHLLERKHHTIKRTMTGTRAVVQQTRTRVLREIVGEV